MREDEFIEQLRLLQQLVESQEPDENDEIWISRAQLQKIGIKPHKDATTRLRKLGISDSHRKIEWFYRIKISPEELENKLREPEKFLEASGIKLRAKQPNLDWSLEALSVYMKDKSIGTVITPSLLSCLVNKETFHANGVVRSLQMRNVIRKVAYRTYEILKTRDEILAMMGKEEDNTEVIRTPPPEYQELAQAIIVKAKSQQQHTFRSDQHHLNQPDKNRKIEAWARALPQ